MTKTRIHSLRPWLILTAIAGAAITLLAPAPAPPLSTSVPSPSAPAPEIDTAVFGVG